MNKRYLAAVYAALPFTPLPLLAGTASCEGVEAVGGACNNTLQGPIATVVNTMLFLAGAVAVGIIIYGGIRYITSTGDPRRIQAAKDTIIYAVAGLVLVLLARFIVAFVIGRVG